MNKAYVQVAVDRGYSSTKVIGILVSPDNQEKTFKFSSSCSVQLNDNVPSNLDTVKVEDEIFIVGDDALSQAHSTSAPSLVDFMSETREFSATIFHAINKLQSTSIGTLKISIADGLYRDLHESIRNRFSGIIDTGSFKCTVQSVDVIPQGHASAHSTKSLKPRGVDSWICIDVGHRTVIFTVWQGNKLNKNRSATLLLGGHLLIDNLANTWVTDSISKQQIVAKFLGATAKSKRHILFKNKTIELNLETPVVRNWGAFVTKAIATKADSLNDLDFAAITGASADLLLPAMKTLYPHLEVRTVRDSQFAVARGMILHRSKSL
jgi:hypothetical protein